MQTPVFSFLAALPLLAPLPLGAQASGGASAFPDPEDAEPRRELASPSASLLRSSFGLAELGGELWAGGPDYKVRFDSTGPVFTPALGAAAARNYPLTFELESIRRGGLELHRAAAVSPERAGEHEVRYARGTGVAELYEVLPEGIEQSFLFTHPPAGGCVKRKLCSMPSGSTS